MEAKGKTPYDNDGDDLEDELEMGIKNNKVSEEKSQPVSVSSEDEDDEDDDLPF
jgi:hypothetical protein